MGDLLARVAAQASLRRTSDKADLDLFCNAVRDAVAKAKAKRSVQHDPLLRGQAWAWLRFLELFAASPRMRRAAALLKWPNWGGGDGSATTNEVAAFERMGDAQLEEHGTSAVAWFEQPLPQQTLYRWDCAVVLLRRAEKATADVAGPCPAGLCWDRSTEEFAWELGDPPSVPSSPD